MSIFGKIMRWIVLIFFGMMFIGFTVSSFIAAPDVGTRILFISMSIVTGGIVAYSIVCLANDENLLWTAITDGEFFSTIGSGLAWFFSKVWFVLKLPFIGLAKLFKWMFTISPNKKSSYSSSKSNKDKNNQKHSYEYYLKLAEKEEKQEQKRRKKEERRNRPRKTFYDTRLYKFFYDRHVKRLERKEAARKEKERQKRIQKGLPPDSLTNYEKEQIEKKEKEKNRNQLYKERINEVEKAFKALSNCFFHWFPWNDGRSCIVIDNNGENICRQDSDIFASENYSTYKRSLCLSTHCDNRRQAGAYFFHKDTIQSHMEELIDTLKQFSYVCEASNIQCILYVIETFYINSEVYHGKYIQYVSLPEVRWTQTYTIRCGYGYHTPELNKKSLRLKYTDDIYNSRGQKMPIRAYKNMSNWTW